MSDSSFSPDPTPAPEDRKHTLAARLQAVAMILIMLVGATEGIVALSSARGSEKLRQNASWAAFLDGHLAGAVNYVMAHDLPSDPILRELGGMFRWRLFHGAGPQVTPGCRNWLFLTEELRPWPNGAAAMQARADAMGRIAAKLAARHVAVLFALVPDKARVEAAQRCGAPYAAQSQARYAAFTALVAARHLPMVNWRDAFAAAANPQPLFYHTDTHWSERGAALAAQTLAAAVPRNLIAPDATFRTDAGMLAKRPGDLLRLMSLEHAPDVLGLRPKPDLERPETTTQLSNADAGGGLLDAAPALQVILLGSSFSVNGNFLGHLEQDLGTAVGQFGEAGGAFSGAAHTYFSNAAWRDTPPKLVIWEIPERVVNQPPNPDEQQFLAGTDTSKIAK